MIKDGAKRFEKGARMGGFHLSNLIVILVIGLLMLGPKLIQSVARDAGKVLGHAKKTKEEVLAELPVEEITKVTSKIPTSPQHAIQMLLTPETPKETNPKVHETEQE